MKAVPPSRSSLEAKLGQHRSAIRVLAARAVEISAECDELAATVAGDPAARRKLGELGAQYDREMDAMVELHDLVRKVERDLARLADGRAS